MKQRYVGQGVKEPRIPDVRYDNMFASECRVQLENFRERLRSSRISFGVSQATLGMAIGTSGRHVGHLESGDRSPSFEEVIAIEIFFRRRRNTPLFDLRWH